MGPKHSSELSKQQPSLNATINHPRFQKARLLSGKEGQYLQISLPITSETEITNWVNGYKPYISHECLLLPISYELKAAQMCGSGGFCSINFPNFPFLLDRQIVDRRGQRKQFSNLQVWYLTFVILEAASVFHSAGKKIGDVRPINVFINDHGQAKIANQLSWPHQFTNYQKTVFDKQITYLSPQEIKDQHFGLTEPKGNYQIAQAFSIGLTLLDSVLLTNSQDIYDITKHRFQYHKLQERIHLLFASTHFDQNLKKIIAGFCKINPSERLKCRQVFQWLNKYRQPIINIEPFQFQQVPTFFLQSQPPRQVAYIQVPRPIVQPLYFQSQVVAHSPQRVLRPQPVQYISNYHPAPFYPVGSVELGRRDPRQVFFEQYSRPVTMMPIHDQALPGRLVPIHERIPNQEQRYNLPLIERRSPPTTQEPSAQLSIPRNQVSVEPIQRKIPERPSSSIEPNGDNKTPNSNQQDFKLTLSKIEEQLAMSRKMFPS